MWMRVLSTPLCALYIWHASEHVHFSGSRNHDLVVLAYRAAHHVEFDPVRPSPSAASPLSAARPFLFFFSSNWCGAECLSGRTPSSVFTSSTSPVVVLAGRSSGREPEQKTAPAIWIRPYYDGHTGNTHTSCVFWCLCVSASLCLCLCVFVSVCLCALLWLCVCL